MGQSLPDIMGQIRGGFAMNEAGKKLNELVAKVRETGKKGSITLTIDVEPDKVDDRVVTLKPSIKTKIPDKGFNPGIFFVDDKGKLSKDDPTQAEMFAERERQGVADLAEQQKNLTRVGRGPD